MTKTITVILADDHQMIRVGFKHMILPFHSEIQLIEEASDGEELIEKMHRYQADVVVTDYHMPKMNGAEVSRIIKNHFPQTGIVSFTMPEDEIEFRSMMESGVTCYLVKTANHQEIRQAICSAYQGEQFFCSVLFNRYIHLLNKTNSYTEEFSFYERKIIQLICEQKTSKEIASILKLRIRTVDDYRHKIQEKTGSKNAVGIALHAVKTKMVDLHDLDKPVPYFTTS